jgi:hypothetical protein
LIIENANSGIAGGFERLYRVRQYEQDLLHESSPFKYRRLQTKASEPYLTGWGIASIKGLLTNRNTGRYSGFSYRKLL